MVVLVANYVFAIGTGKKEMRYVYEKMDGNAVIGMSFAPVMAGTAGAGLRSEPDGSEGSCGRKDRGSIGC